MSGQMLILGKETSIERKMAALFLVPVAEEQLP